MITWVTVWVLTVHGNMSAKNTQYQLTYATQQACLKQIKNHKKDYYIARCDFQQVPMVTK